MIFKFVDWEVSPLEELKGTKIDVIYKKLQNEDEEKLSREEKNWVFEKLQTNAYSRTGIPLMGWMFDLSDYLKTYWVKTRYYGILEVYSLDKTSIRNYFGSYYVLEIMEVKNEAA